MHTSNIVFTNPYFTMRTIGSYGLVSLSKINEIIQNESIKYVEIAPEPIKKIVSTASLQATGTNPNYIGASHCQEGQGENVYNLLNIVNIENIENIKNITNTNTNITNITGNDYKEDEQKIKRKKLGGKKYTKKKKQPIKTKKLKNKKYKRTHKGNKKQKI